MTARIRPRPVVPHAGILGVGAYRPERVVTNAEVCELIDSTDEWIRERSGIVERRYASAEESVVDMAVTAAGRAMAHAGVTADRIGAVLVATVTHPFQTPAASTEVADRLGATGAGALDISAACAGFCYGLGLADGMVRTRNAEHVLVIGVEKLTDFVSRTDRSTAFIFADGAGAAVVGPTPHTGIGPTLWGADGAQREAIILQPDWVSFREQRDEVDWPSLQMQGQAVFRWAVGEMTKVARQALAEAGVEAADLDAFIPHQANMRITDAMVRALKLPEHVVVARDIATTGNTSAASIPLAMARMLEAGEVRSGDTALLIGFGAGLTYAAQVVTLP